MGSAAPVIIAVVAVAASVVAGPEMGAAILGYGDSIEAVAAGYSVSTLSAVGAAASGAAAGAITEAQKSGDPTKILEAAGVGAVGGAVGSEVGGAVGGAAAWGVARGGMALRPRAVVPVGIRRYSHPRTSDWPRLQSRADGPPCAAWFEFAA